MVYDLIMLGYLSVPCQRSLEVRQQKAFTTYGQSRIFERWASPHSLPG